MRELREGDSIEVLWILDVTVESGRRKGQKNKKDVWWRGKVSGVGKRRGEFVALVQYDAGYGMGESGVSARFMKNKLQHKQDDGTLLCMQQWRYYKRDFSECDDGISSSDDDYSALEASCTKRNCFTSLCDHTRTASRVASLELRVDDIQRLLSAQSGIYSRLLRYKTESDVISDRAFGFLRQRMANACQRAIQLPRIRTAVTDVVAQEGRHIGMCFTRALRADTDCTLAEMEQICRVVRMRTPTATFYPTYEETQSPRSDIETITILFDSLGCLGKCIGFTSVSDLQYFMVKGRKMRRMEVSDQSAFRLLGGTLADNDSEKSMFIFRVAGSQVCTATDKMCELLFRENMCFDRRNRTYANRLEKKV